MKLHYHMINHMTHIWHNISIRRKLITFFSLLLIIILSLYLYILNNSFNYTKTYEKELNKTSLIQELSIAISNNKESFKSCINDYSSENFEEFETTIEPLWESWVRVKNNANTSLDAFFQIEAIRYGVMAYLESAKESIWSLNNDIDNLYIHKDRAERIEGYIEGYMSELIDIRLAESSGLHTRQNKAIIQVRQISIISICVLGLITIIFVNLFSNNISKPIIKLATLSEQLSNGDIKVEQVQVNSKDEIGILSNSFNTMSRNLFRMITSLEDKARIEKENHEMTKSLKEAQFLSLQSQINPHFLFNTLNTIARMSMFEEAPQTVKLIESLSHIFRYNLNNQDKLINLDDEIKILNDYMYIQKTRYGNRLNYEVLINCNIDKIKIPIFTLQPLVENAVVHGIEPKEDGGLVSLFIDHHNGNLVIIIKDTGIGFDTEVLNDDTKRHNSIGLTNVKKRLSLKYQNMDKFEIVSDVNKGTQIKITLPEKTYV